MNELAGFSYRFVPGGAATTLLLLHGTGGDENDLVELGRRVAPQAHLLSPRGRVLERGLPRFFRRLAEGVFDLEDLHLRTHELADFVAATAERHAFDPGQVVALGFSNGANIAASLLLLRPRCLYGAAMLRPMVPFEPGSPPELGGVRVLVSAGRNDPIAPPEGAERLAAILRAAGALVEVRLDSGGHGIGPAEVQAVQEWLGAGV